MRKPKIQPPTMVLRLGQLLMITMATGDMMTTEGVMGTKAITGVTGSNHVGRKAKQRQEERKTTTTIGGQRVGANQRPAWGATNQDNELGEKSHNRT